MKEKSAKYHFVGEDKLEAEGIKTGISCRKENIENWQDQIEIILGRNEESEGIVWWIIVEKWVIVVIKSWFFSKKNGRGENIIGNVFFLK